MLLENALEYARKGIAIFPCHTPIFENGKARCSCNHADCKNIGKHPRTAKGFKDATTDIEKIKHWWDMWPEANIGAVCEKIFIIDCDSIEAVSFVANKGIINTYHVTRGEHLHYYFKMPETPIERKTKVADIDLDFLGSGGYAILAPSLHSSGETYSNDRTFDYETLADVPKWVYEYAHAANVPAIISDNMQTVKNDEISEIQRENEEWLEALQTDLNKYGEALDDPEHRKEFLDNLKTLYDKGYFNAYDRWIKCEAAFYHSGKFTVEDFFTVTHPDDAARESARRKWASFENGEEGKKVRIGTLITWIRQELDKEFFSGEYFRAKNIKRSNEQFQEHIKKSEETKKYPWIDQKMPPIMWNLEHCKITKKKTEDGRQKQTIRALPTIDNFKRMLSYYGIVLREDLMRHMIRDCIKGKAEDTEGKSSNAFAEILRSACALNEFPATQNTINSLYIGVGHETKIHPVKEWLDTDDGTGPAWDGVARFDQVCDLIHETASCNKNLKRALLKAWCVSCIAALYEEHFRTRGVLVIQGPQACGKTSVLKSLFPKFAFLEGASFIAGNKDSVEQLISHWCCELSEIEVLFKKSDISQIKAFLTNEKDVIRFPYEHRSEEIPRRTVFCGSVNEETFLQDKTGNSRFWVIPATYCTFKHSIDIRQFWLEVREMYRAGEKWWLDPDIERELEESNVRHSGEDPLSSILFSYYDPAEKPSRVLTCTEILIEMGYKEGNIKRTDANELARIIKKTGAFKPGVKSVTKSPGWKMPQFKEKNARDVQAASDLTKSEELDLESVPF